MKIHLLVMSLLIFSVFATSMAFAEGTGPSVKARQIMALDPVARAEVESSVTADQVAANAGTISADEIASVQADIDAATVTKQKVGFAKAHPGNGWTDGGEIVHIMWLSEDAVTSAGASTTTYSYGALHLRSSDGATNYRLVSTTSTENDITFTVFKGNENAGTLTVHATSTVKDLTIWEGKLSLKDGTSRTLNFATLTSTLRKGSSDDNGVREVGQGGGKSLLDDKNVRENRGESQGEGSDSGSSTKVAPFWKRWFGVK